MVHFSRGSIVDGKVVITEGRDIEQSSIQKCPHYIMIPNHYRDDETCRCNDEGHTEMAEWGYAWVSGMWL